MSTPENPDDHKPISDSSEKEGKANRKLEELYEFTQSNTKDTIALVVLLLGILLSLWAHLWGGLLIGAVAGVYFDEAIIEWATKLRGYFESEGAIRSLILGGVILGLFIAAPAIFIGAAAAIGIKQMVVTH